MAGRIALGPVVPGIPQIGRRMRHKKWFKLGALVFLGLTVFVILVSIRGKNKDIDAQEYEIDGKEMVSTVYNKDNQKALELRCRESRRESEDRVWMRDIVATIYKKGRLDHDIEIKGEWGFVENNFYNFAIKRKGVITAPDLLVKSNDFYLRDRSLLSSESRVDYRVKFLQGLARKGMRLNLENNSIILYKTVGTYQKDGRTFNYRSDELLFEENKLHLWLMKKNEIKNPETTLRADKMVLRFAAGFNQPKEITAWGNGYIYLADKAAGGYKEIEAGHIKSLYDDQGNLESTGIDHAKKIVLKDKHNATSVTSATLDIRYFKKAGNIASMAMPTFSKIVNKGKTDFVSTAAKMDIAFDETGELKLCKSRGKSTFKVDDYQGISFLMMYEVQKNLVSLQGKGSEVYYEKNSFTSTRFDIDTEAKRLTSKVGVKAVIFLEKNQVLFSKDVIYIDAGELDIDNRVKTIAFRGQTKLRQKDVRLEAERLKIDQDDNIRASGGEGGLLSLIFKNKEEDIAIKGKEIVVDAKNRRITITGKGMVRSGDNLLKAELIKVVFSPESEIAEVTGEKGSEFIREDMSGSARQLSWLYDRDEVIFRESAQIERKGKGKSRGTELHFFLKTNRILIVADDAQRTQTIIE